ncbi:hypothetical protein M0R45_008035 [Rubus argutus]|uniref:Bulb-type lectin domain-containing protein n=1 Tax=Rubus argutus TaxID=59490 RepID=A0AAW1Y0X4_RUBAR
MGKQKSIWSTNVTSQVSSSNTSSVTALLLDNGNLVVNDHLGAELWKSFDYPSDTVLPNMVLRYDKSGKGNFLISWKSENDPSPGDLAWIGTTDSITRVHLESIMDQMIHIQFPYWRRSGTMG